ncbi:MAG: hypothetical protein ABL984_00430 [Pyrinomonadaceae bacterium]
MKHARKDYNRIQDPAGLIPEDEPVFLFRAQDRFAAKVLDHYASILEAEVRSLDEAFVDSEVANNLAEVAAATREQARKFRHWPNRKTPDLDKGGPG